MVSVAIFLWVCEAEEVRKDVSGLILKILFFLTIRNLSEHKLFVLKLK